MTDSHFYTTIEITGMAEFKDRGSRFIAFAYPLKNVAAFKNILAAIKKQHPKANHHCFAYRVGTGKDAYRSSDDGEPAGTAGKPILGQIDSRGLTDILVIVVRYFGGTLLGVPGLINAYKSAAAMVLQVTPFVRKPVLKVYHLEFDYTLLNDVLAVIRLTDCVVQTQELQLFCHFVIGVPTARLEDALLKFNDINNLQIAPADTPAD